MQGMFPAYCTSLSAKSGKLTPIWSTECSCARIWGQSAAVRHALWPAGPSNVQRTQGTKEPLQTPAFLFKRSPSTPAHSSGAFILFLVLSLSWERIHTLAPYSQHWEPAPPTKLCFMQGMDDICDPQESQTQGRGHKFVSQAGPPTNGNECLLTMRLLLFLRYVSITPLLGN